MQLIKAIVFFSVMLFLTKWLLLIVNGQNGRNDRGENDQYEVVFISLSICFVQNIEISREKREKKSAASNAFSCFDRVISSWYVFITRYRRLCFFSLGFGLIWLGCDRQYLVAIYYYCQMIKARFTSALLPFGILLQLLISMCTGIFCCSCMRYI